MVISSCNLNKSINLCVSIVHHLEVIGKDVIGLPTLRMTDKPVIDTLTCLCEHLAWVLARQPAWTHDPSMQGHGIWLRLIVPFVVFLLFY